jgi:hypothetical protein
MVILLKDLIGSLTLSLIFEVNFRFRSFTILRVFIILKILKIDLGIGVRFAASLKHGMDGMFFLFAKNLNSGQIIYRYTLIASHIGSRQNDQVVKFIKLRFLKLLVKNIFLLFLRQGHM